MDDQKSQQNRRSTEHVLDQVREALNDVAGSASEVAGACSAGASAMRVKLANSTLKLSIMLVTLRLVTRHTTGNPLLSLFVAGATAMRWPGLSMARDETGTDTCRIMPEPDTAMLRWVTPNSSGDVRVSVLGGSEVIPPLFKGGSDGSN